MARTDTNRVAVWIAIVVVAVLLIGAVFLLSQCGPGTGDGGGGGY
jgi:preprotein translocase subunit SecG